MSKGLAGDADRREEGRIPEGVSFATETHLVEWVLARVWEDVDKEARVPGDPVYGNDVHLRRTLESSGQPYLLAVKSDQRLYGGRCRDGVEAITDRFLARAWRKASAGAWSKEPRVYDWAAEWFGKVGARG